MKVSKLPGFGSFGSMIENFEWDQPEAYKELKEINLKSLVTVVKGNGADNFMNIVKNSPNNLVTKRPNRFVIKYQTTDFMHLLSDDERQTINLGKNIALGKDAPGWLRVTGHRNEKDQPTGVFGDSELHWHSNNMMLYDFEPLVMLYGASNMSTSATSFVQTADWYQNQSESFKSELDELVTIAVRDAKVVVPNIRKEDEILNVIGPETQRIPLVFNSPGGIRGLRLNPFMTKFEGMSQEDSDNLFNKMKSEIFTTENEFPWWWSDDHELLLFDNSITLHRRLFQEGVNMTQRLYQRLGYRFSGDYAGLEMHNGYVLPEFRTVLQDTLDLIKSINRT